MVRRPHRLFDGEIRHEPRRARPCGRIEEEADRGQRALAAHHHCDFSDPEPARRRRGDARLADARHPRRRRAYDLPQGLGDLQRQFPDRRHVSARERGHGFRPLPRRPDRRPRPRFLRPRRLGAAGESEEGGITRPRHPDPLSAAEKGRLGASFSAFTPRPKRDDGGGRRSQVRRSQGRKEPTCRSRGPR